MANYVFENITDAQAAAFTGTDKLIFLNATDATITVDFVPGVGLIGDAIRITSGSISHSFVPANLATASAANNLILINGDILQIGGTGADTLDLSTNAAGAVSGKGGEAYGFAGNDTITASIANDTIFGGDGNDRIVGSSTSTENGDTTNSTDYYTGGAGNDTIIGGAGNDHLYGNVFAGGANSGDGADSIDGGLGNDFIRGGAGNDTLLGGAGNDRIQGSGDNDSIVGGAGNDDLNGNLENDTVSGGDGNDTVGGGQGNDVVNGDDGNDSVLGGQGDDTIDGGLGNDVVNGGAGNDVASGGTGNDVVGGGDGNDLVNGDAGNDTLTGDAGVDTLVGGAGFDVLTGGAGNDVFRFDIGDAGNSNIPGSGATAGLTDTIADYADGSDKIDLNRTVTGVTTGFVPGVVLTNTQNFDTLANAQTFAQQTMDNNGAANNTELVALKVGADSYLFYYGDSAATAIDSVIKVTGVDPAVFNVGTNSDFI